jgi:hypothetical protein
VNKTPEIRVEDFLRGFTPSVRELAEEARKQILSVVPHATERVRLGWRLIGYNAPAYFAFISFEREHVRIGFEWGILLPNDSGLLEGTGSQVRYVTIRSPANLGSAGLIVLLQSAAAIVPPARVRR